MQTHITVYISDTHELHGKLTCRMVNAPSLRATDFGFEGWGLSHGGPPKELSTNRPASHTFVRFAALSPQGSGHIDAGVIVIPGTTLLQRPRRSPEDSSDPRHDRFQQG
jgi:hypothetical protein